MNDKNVIKETADDIYFSDGFDDYREKSNVIANDLIKKGYGNVKQEIKELGTEIHNMLVDMVELDFDTREKICNKIDNLITNFMERINEIVIKNGKEIKLW